MIYIFSGSRTLDTLPNGVLLRPDTLSIFLSGNEYYLHQLPGEVYHGASGNLDKCADAMAQGIQDMTSVPFPYPDGMGRRGGPIRNGQMIDDAIAKAQAYGVRVKAFAFLEWGRDCRGTSDFIAQYLAKRKNGLGSLMGLEVWMCPKSAGDAQQALW